MTHARAQDGKSAIDCLNYVRAFNYTGSALVTWNRAPYIKYHRCVATDGAARCAVFSAALKERTVYRDFRRSEEFYGRMSQPSTAAWCVGTATIVILVGLAYKKGNV